MECPVKFPRPLAAALAVAALSMSGVIALAAPAAAHTPQVSATCSDLSVRLDSYEEGRGQYDRTPNKVTITVDTATLVTENFGRSFYRDVSLGDKTLAHAWTVVIDAVGTGYDRTFSGTSTPCAPPPPIADAAASVSITEPTCTDGAKLVLGVATNATWSTPTATTGPASYSVTANALNGHVFADTTQSQTFTGQLNGKLDPTKPPCYTPPVEPPVDPPVDPPMPEQPEPVVTVDVDEVAHCDTDEIVTTTTTTTVDTVPNPDGTPTWVSTTPVVVVTSTTRAAEDQECPDPDFTDGDGGGGDGGGSGGTPEFTADGDTLAVTGVDMGWAPWFAGFLALAGAALLAYPRLRTVLTR